MTNQTTTPATGPAIDRAKFIEPSPYDTDGGYLIGKHPRDVTLADLRSLPAPWSPMKAIRAKCLDCSNSQPSEVRKCVSVGCALWPFRMGFSPYHARSTVSQNAGGLEGAFSDSAADLNQEAR